MGAPLSLAATAIIRVVLIEAILSVHMTIGNIEDALNRETPLWHTVAEFGPGFRGMSVANCTDNEVSINFTRWLTGAKRVPGDPVLDYRTVACVDIVSNFGADKIQKTAPPRCTHSAALLHHAPHTSHLFGPQHQFPVHSHIIYDNAIAPVDRASNHIA